MAFAALTIDLNARLANIEGDLGRVAQLAEKNAQRIDRAFSAMGATLGGLGAGIGLAGLVANLKDIVDQADGIKDLATSTQTSVEALASFKLIAEQSGTSLESVGKGINKVTKFMGENAAEAAQLGITAQDPIEAFLQFAAALEKTATPADKVVIANKVLGKTYEELLPLLSEGSAQIRASSQASAQYAAGMAKLAPESDKFKDLLAQLNQNIAEFKIGVAEDLLPILNAALEEINATGNVSGAAAEALSKLGTIGQTIAVLWANVEFVFKGVGKEIGGIAAQLVAVAQGDFAGAISIGEEMQKDAEKSRSAFDEYERSLLGLAGGLKAFGAAKSDFKNGIKDGDFKADDILSEAEAEKIQSSLRKAFDIKPLDDFINDFARRNDQIKQEYAKLRAEMDVGSQSGGTGLDVTAALERARSAFQGGDTTTAGAQLARAKSTLRGLAEQGVPSFETAYLSRQLEAFELSMNAAAQRTAENTRDVLAKNIEAIAQDVARIPPIKIPLAVDAIGDDLRRQIDDLRKDLAANPLQIPASVIADDAANIRRAASKLGSR